ncbi:TraR/DksA C4-type zinc finger protein [Lentibacillus salicampi]|uniref:YteA family sporulation protein n=1 Tax=Lentibacillus salicampi TaxID=175306 RepID=A0A4Y9AD83_9BACI|nr:TraR/DksA C4-type zinc finger protein [Lentibacillus salicampi]TFJ92331.1 yteA family sporulation protein [Lentibacillus salicampi]
MMTNDQLNQCKNELLERQNALIPQVQGHFGTSLEMTKQSMDELSNYDNHPGDMGTEMFEREKDIALNEHAEKELKDINAALHAIADGTYGICSECGRDIPFERLEAIPTADRCFEHAEDLDNLAKADRPVEEGVFSPNINPDEITDEEQTGYDAEDAWQEVSRYGTSETASDFYGDRDNYDDMYPNSDENVGSVTDEESFLAADREGNFTGVTPNHKEYEE